MLERSGSQISFSCSRYDTIAFTISSVLNNKYIRQAVVYLSAPVLRYVISIAFILLMLIHLKEGSPISLYSPTHYLTFPLARLFLLNPREKSHRLMENHQQSLYDIVT